LERGERYERGLRPLSRRTPLWGDGGIRKGKKRMLRGRRVGGVKREGRNKAMLKPHDVPECIVEAMLRHDITDEDKYLYGCGRAIAFIRMAAEALDELGNEQKVAEYHGYAGISAARTSIDAATNWLNIALGIKQKQSSALDIAKDGFYKNIVDRRPSIILYVDCLRSLAKEIDRQRQRAQHREGLGLWYYSSGDWHLAEPNVPKNQYRRIDSLLREWADTIEEQICRMIQVLSL